MGNPNFGQEEEYSGETDWSIVALKSVFIRNGVDINFTNRLTVGLNIGLDLHPNIKAIPYYIDTKFAISKVDDDKFYLSAGFGKLLPLTTHFEKGMYYNAGLGYQISTEKSYSFILSLRYHSKKIARYKNGQLKSVSFGLGMAFF